MENLLKQGQPKWIPGTIIERMGSVMYRVQVGEQIWRRYADQLRAREETGTAVNEKDTQIDDNDINFPTSAVATTNSANSSGAEPSHSLSNSMSTSPGELQNSEEATPELLLGTFRYPTRTHKPPDRLIEQC